jgi:hypothetical protein
LYFVLCVRSYHERDYELFETSLRALVYDCKRKFDKFMKLLSEDALGQLEITITYFKLDVSPAYESKRTQDWFKETLR